MCVPLIFIACKCRFVEMYRSRSSADASSLLSLPHPLPVAASLASRTIPSVAKILLDFGPACSSSIEVFTLALREAREGRAMDEWQVGELLVSLLPGTEKPGAGDDMGAFNIVQGIDEDEKSVDVGGCISGGSGAETGAGTGICTGTREGAGGSKQSPGSWQVNVIADVLTRECEGLNWASMVRAFDCSIVESTVTSQEAFQILASLVLRVSGRPLNAEGLMGSWGHKRAQLILLAHSASAPAYLVDFSGLLSSESLLGGEDGKGNKGKGKGKGKGNVVSGAANVPTPENSAWLCQPVYTTLISLANLGFAAEVLRILLDTATIYPEYVVFARISSPIFKFLHSMLLSSIVSFCNYV